MLFSVSTQSYFSVSLKFTNVCDDLLIAHKKRDDLVQVTNVGRDHVNIKLFDHIRKYVTDQMAL